MGVTESHHRRLLGRIPDSSVYARKFERHDSQDPLDSEECKDALVDLRIKSSDMLYESYSARRISMGRLTLWDEDT